MRSPAIVVLDPCSQESAKMRLRQRHQPVETLPAQRADHALADSIHLRTVRGGFEYAESERLDRLIELSGEDAVAVMEQELIPVIDTDDFP